MLKKLKFYSLKKIMSYNAQYNIIVGERSNGKTYSVLEYAITEYIQSGFKNALAIVRRWDEDFKGGKATSFFQSHIENGLITKLTKGEYTTIIYLNRAWYFAKYDETGKAILHFEPFAHAFTLTQSEHYKMNSFPNITTILFDEFLTRRRTVTDEFNHFISILSTIIRLRTNVKIFMLGNTVNKESLYFKEMGLSNIENMVQGEIVIYKYGTTNLKVAFEYCASFEKMNGKKESNVYFAFDNPRLNMTRTGGWEFDLYPRLTQNNKYDRKKDVKYKFFIIFNEKILQCDCIERENEIFIYIFRKTTQLRNYNTDLIYSNDCNNKVNYRQYINRPLTKVEKVIYKLFLLNKIYYSDNDVGELVRNYLNFCKTDSKMI